MNYTFENMTYYPIVEFDRFDSLYHCLNSRFTLCIDDLANALNKVIIT